ncbi:MAG: DoxX family protein [Myxococcales bacterium]
MQHTTTIPPTPATPAFPTKARTITYWTTTALIAFFMLSGGVSELVQRPETMEGMLRLGYPSYFIAILGFWKVLGALVLLAPGLVRLKEWAYAGIVFNMTGAFVSHLVIGSERWHLAVTAVIALMTLTSWALRPANRVLGILPLLRPAATP